MIMEPNPCKPYMIYWFQPRFVSFKFYKRCKASQISTVFAQISIFFSHEHIPEKLPTKINFEELGLRIMYPENIKLTKLSYRNRQLRGLFGTYVFIVTLLWKVLLKTGWIEIKKVQIKSNFCVC